MQGYLDSIGIRSIWGWALGENDTLPELTAWVNGMPVCNFRPSLLREDLKRLPRSDLGFHIDLGGPLNAGDLVGVTNREGEHLERSPRKALSSEWSRFDMALCLVNREMKILEIGPAYNPLTPRSKGWNSFSLDHATEAELKAKYQGQQAIERIEAVDFIWKQGPMEDAIPGSHRNTFDVIIASHVLEHMPDPIAFFVSAMSILKAGGLISLILPDKRFSFDFFKPLTMTSDYLYAHHSRRTRHSKKTAFDNGAYNVSENGEIVWSARPTRNFNTLGEDTLLRAKEMFDETIEDESAQYVDFHATNYTPSSFALIIFELSQLGLIPFDIERAFPTTGAEFYVSLRNRPPRRMSSARIKEERLRLMKVTVREIGQQARWLLDD